jgi:ssDNA-binding Zn-finger/Zn-ribbon topoisomerase 1
MSPYDDPAVSAGEIADYLHSPSSTMEDNQLPEQPALAPCPWCGTPPVLLPALRHGYFVGCENAQCPVSPETTFDAETPEQAAERWNHRPTPQAA